VKVRATRPRSTVNATTPGVVLHLGGSKLDESWKDGRAWGFLRLRWFGARGRRWTRRLCAGSGGRIDECERERDAFDRSQWSTIAASSVTLYRSNYITVTGTASYGGGSIHRWVRELMLSR